MSKIFFIKKGKRQIDINGECEIPVKFYSSFNIKYIKIFLIFKSKRNFIQFSFSLIFFSNMQKIPNVFF